MSIFGQKPLTAMPSKPDCPIVMGDHLYTRYDRFGLAKVKVMYRVNNRGAAVAEVLNDEMTRLLRK